MKRLRIWLKELTLSQQLLTLTFMVVAVFSLFFFVYLTNNIDMFVNKQMYDVIHRSQSSIITSLDDDNDISKTLSEYSDTSVYHIMYYVNEDIYRTYNKNQISAELSDDLEYKISLMQNDVLDSRYEEKSGITLYSILKIDNNRYLISGMNDTFRTEFRDALLNGVINLNIWVVMILFSCLMMWVGFLIHPLNQIRVYIDKIKNGEDATLKIDRRDEIGEVADALVLMQEELKKQEAVKEEMIQNISHDLKTPIATIKSYGESIKDGIYPYETLEKSVDVIIEHADRLEKKVYSLIMLNKMGYLMDSAPDGDTLDMSSVIQKVLLSLKVIRPEIQFVTNLNEVYFHGDEDPWRIVIENLLDNALRYAQTIIEITLDNNELTIYNDGQLLSKERQEKMFKPYEKGTDGKFGLGLSIVQRVCNTYGYKVIGENKNDGVVFRIYR